MKHYNVVSIYIILYVPFFRYVYQHNVGNAEQNDKKVAKCQREYVPKIFDGPFVWKEKKEEETRMKMSGERIYHQDGKQLSAWAAAAVTQDSWNSLRLDNEKKPHETRVQHAWK